MPNLRINIGIFHDFAQFIENLDISAPTLSPRLHNPHISRAVHFCLWVFFSQFLDLLRTNYVNFFPQSLYLWFFRKSCIFFELREFPLNLLKPCLFFHKRLEAFCINPAPFQAAPLSRVQSEFPAISLTFSVDLII